MFDMLIVGFMYIGDRIVHVTLVFIFIYANGGTSACFEYQLLGFRTEAKTGE